MPPKKISSSYGNKLGSSPAPKNKPRQLTVIEKDLFKKYSFSPKHTADMKKFLKAGRGCWADAHAFALTQK